jgi:hypothetical protein
VLVHCPSRLADQPGESAKGDPLAGVNLRCGRVDPHWRGEIRLRREPSVERGLVKKRLPVSSAVSAT